MTTRQIINSIIFGTETKAGKRFDIILIILILVSIANGMLESLNGFNSIYGHILKNIEWVLTALFSIEYIARLYSAKDRLAYATSFLGVIDVLSVLPSYISLFFPSTQYFSVIRILRVLRIFRILKLAAYIKEYEFLLKCITNSSKKIAVFLFGILTLVIILGSIMYVIEPDSAGFTSIPKSIYWAIVTLTTVGYGDIYPKTALGQFISSIVMIMGYGIIAVPAGLVTSEMVVQKKAFNTDNDICNSCGQKINHKH